ncbi:PQQ-dependent sugar dehydrogenase [Hyphomonas sp. WL0036]|uniref:PQQ-dependent sugar dehydrogenase n=1 Tax=Hyphomonas sediminis TaxID=2866160 RepID=UPI001C7F0548|nr:PQQ-dependent sugar dehydrogenase [Hyphomonas sediminis]MBY9066446.1 PQQ-dependent sugar dehydrogenase [Hyphomonas sediminis]
MKQSVIRNGSWVALAAASVVALQACGGGGGSGSSSPPPPPPPPPPANRAPQITSAANVSIDEGVTGAIYTLTATDADGDPITLATVSGGDEGVFSFNPTSGVLSLNTALDFEAPRDADRNNVYEITFRASDGRGGETRLTLRVTVRDVDETIANMALRRVGTGFSAPLYVAGIPGTDRVVVLEKGGRARVLNPETGVIDGTDFLNVTADVATAGEQGLVGIAFSPSFATDRRIYVNLINRSGNTEIRRYQVSASNPLVVDTSTRDVILTMNQVDAYHNGGWLGFGNDGLLYLATGDGGGITAGADQSAQNTNSLLGKILRIDVSGDDFPADANRDYRIPSGNAFPGGVGGAPEIFALGLRNPWRSSFDPVTGDLLIADVGQGAIEEINRMRSSDAGANYGWAQREGTQPYNGGANSPAFTPPVAEYSHGTGPTQGRSITGGYVYRGNIGPIRNHYVFGDFISGNVWSVPLSSLVVGQTLSSSQFIRLNDDLVPDAGTLSQISSFGMDNGGAIYIVSYGGSIFRIEGAP